MSSTNEARVPPQPLERLRSIGRHLHEHHRTSERATRSDEEIDNYWGSYITEEPISNELKLLVKADLLKTWHYRRFEEFRCGTKIRWATIDSYRILLSDAVGNLKPSKLKYLCNKPTPFYWLQSAQQTNNTGERTLTPKIIFATVYEEWYRCYKNDPNIEFGHFFANPFRVTSTGPSTIRGIVEAHRSISTQASSLIYQADGRADNIVERSPSSSQHYSVLPLYRAIVMVLDRLDYSFNSTPRPPGLYHRKPEDFISLRQVAKDQTVLLARTGVEDGLSAPISFESLRSQSLPLDRSDIITQDIDVVRVSLATAVRFVIDLEIREALAGWKNEEPPRDSRLGPFGGPKGFEYDKDIRRSPETWADAYLAAAEVNGYDNDSATWESIRRVQASLVGEDFRPFEHWPWGNAWKVE